MEYMEAQMQRQFGAWDAQMAAAQADRDEYARNMARENGWECCLAIEEAWGLVGYPPEIVSTVLHEVAGGKGFDEALEWALTPEAK